MKKATFERLSRSQTMARVRSSDTGPERQVRRVLTDLGYRYRLQRKDLPGKPDIVFSSRRRVIFVHGCFWHGHGCKRGARRPKTNQNYWEAKINRNMQRDGLSVAALSAEGWEVLVVWECETRDLEHLREVLAKFLSRAS